ncbi:hypothetical protein GCM10010182_02330 [Actinomadura cremea]|nr:hypothetical protein GCM10010182_02330 [Actinomadura cremea]
MSRISKKAAFFATTAAAALTVTMTATPALAWPAGNFTATLDGTMVIDAGIPASCTDSTLSGTIAADGTLSVTSASVSGCGVTVTPVGLPWSGSLSGGVASFDGFQMSAIGCTFGGDISGSYSGGETFPVTASFTEQTVDRTAGWLCPSSATITASYTFS